MPTRDPRVDVYVAKAAPFARPILAHLRKVVHAGCPGVEETIKWRFPAFMYKGIFAGMAGFKGHCTFGFWKGGLLKEHGLTPADEAAMGQFGRITSLKDLPNEKALIKYVKLAATLNDQGVKVPARPKRAAPPLKTPAQLLSALKKNKRALATFEGFSPSRRKDYVEWVTEAKTDETRTRRVDTAVAWMAEGKSRNWKYEKC
jgi:uncharacterized protein YdeI (YjbR/CyaY-like superfamily)